MRLPHHSLDTIDGKAVKNLASARRNTWRLSVRVLSGAIHTPRIWTGS